MSSRRVRRIPRVVEVSPEYDGTFLRDRSGIDGGYVPVTSDLLGMSQGLRRRFEDWNRRWQVHSRSYIYDDVPDDPVTEEALDREGLLLAKDLQQELDARDARVVVTFGWKGPPVADQ